MNKAWEVQILQEVCKGCYICVKVCPREVFSVEDEPGAGGFKPVAVARPQNCTGCMLCVIYCPDFATEVREIAPQKV